MIRLNIDYYIEHVNPPPNGFIDGMERMLLNDYLFLPNNRATRETIKQDISCYIQEHWPLYPLGSLVVDSLGAYDVNITVRMQDQIDGDADEDLINYECEYYIDMHELVTEAAAQQLDQVELKHFTSKAMGSLLTPESFIGMSLGMTEQPEVILSADDVMFSQVVKHDAE